MTINLRWLLGFLFTLLLPFLALSPLAFGQGPIPTSLPTPTAAPGPPQGDSSSEDQLTSAALPDLVVTNIETDPATPLVGEPTIISVTIMNNSSNDLPPANNFLTDLYIDPPFEPVVNYHQLVSPTLGLPWGAQWFFVPAGGVHVFTTTWVFTDIQTFEIWAQVDSGNDVVEVTEDNNTKQFDVSVLTTHSFTDDSHQDFLTNMASTLDNSHSDGILRLSRFIEPPFFQRPFADSSCQITSVNTSDYNMQSPDTRINDVKVGAQTKPHLIANGDGVLIAVWEDGRNGDLLDRDIFLRYSTNYGLTWEPEVRVNDDPAGANQLNPVAALSNNGDLLVAWQDFRTGNYDIYAQQFVLNSSTLTKSGSNILVASDNLGQAQINPDIAVDEAGGFHVVWQDKRNGHYDIFATSFISGAWSLVRRVHDDFGITQQVNPTVEVLDWRKVVMVDYTIAPVEPFTVTVNNVISQPATIMVVTWEDDRNGDTDIATVVSGDGGETFDIDQLLTQTDTDGDQREPDVTLTKNIATINLIVPLPDGSQTTVPVEVPVTDIHTVWEGFNSPDHTDRDIYYNKSQLSAAQVGSSNAFNFELSVGSSEKINQQDARAWQTSPVDQRDPALAAVPCGGDAAEEAWNLFITWADGRNYDSANYDIYYSLKSSCGASLDSNEMLNDGVRLHNFDSTNPSYADYDRGHPPPGRQLNPGVAADIQLQGLEVSGGYLYLVWEDDRAGDPQTEKDIYFARSNLTFFNQTPYLFNDGAGSQISKILDSGGPDTTWFTLAWSATTDDSTYVTVQTRLGNTITEVLASAWYPQRFPFQPQPGACNISGDAFNSGAPLQGYDAPGQHLEDEVGNFWPQARYIQYRINFYTRNETNSPELDNLTIYYDPSGNSGNSGGSGSNRTYLPVLLK